MGPLDVLQKEDYRQYHRMQKTRQDMMIKQTPAIRNASKDGKCSQGKLKLFLKEIASAVLLSIAAGMQMRKAEDALWEECDFVAQAVSEPGDGPCVEVLH